MSAKCHTLIVLLVIALSIMVLSACGEEQHTVRLTVDDVVVDSYALTDSNIIIEPEQPVKEGYSFRGWFLQLPDNSLCEDPYVFGGSLASDVNLVAVFDVYKYAVTFVSGSHQWSVNVNYGDLVKTPTDIINNGYQLEGWHVANDAQCEITPYDFQTPITDNITITADWVAIVYSIDYQLNGGENSNNNALTYNVLSGELQLCDATRPGYTFLGWYSDETFVKQVTAIHSGSTGNITLHAKWQANSYTIKFDSCGGNDVAVITVAYGEPYNLATPTKKGYAFDSWTLDGQLVAKSGVWDIAENITLAAVYQQETYSISYDSDGGNYISPFDVTYGEQYFLAVAEKVGYTFAAWKYGDDVVANSGTWQYDSSITLVAIYTPNNYIINFNENGGDEVDSITVTYGQHYNLSYAVRAGCTFNGWYNGAELFASSGVWQTTCDITLIAKWTANEYVVSFDGGYGDNLVTSVMVVYGEHYSFDDCKKEGYTFNYWTYNGEPFESEGTWEIACDVTLVANYTANNCQSALCGTGFDSCILFDSDSVLTTDVYGLVTGINCDMPLVTACRASLIDDEWNNR